MSKSRLWRLGWALAAACCAAVLLGSIAAGNASAADCTVDRLFRMGLTNTCNEQTTLVGSASLSLFVSSQPAGATAILGVADASTGAGIGVEGRTYSGGTNAVGVVGYLGSTLPGSGSAGVFGQSPSTNANGPGV